MSKEGESSLLPAAPGFAPADTLSVEQTLARLPGLLGVKNCSLLEERLSDLQAAEHEQAVKLLDRIADRLDSLLQPESDPEAEPEAPHLGALATANAVEEPAKPADLPAAEQQIIPPQVYVRKICNGEFGGRRIANTSIWKIMGDIGAHPKKIPDKGNTKAWTITDKEYQCYLAHMNKKYPLVEPDMDVTISAICEELGRSWPEVVSLAPRVQAASYARYSDRRQPISCISAETAEWLRANIGVRHLSKSRHAENWTA